MLKLLLATTVLLALAFVGLAISMLLKKNGRFPELHIGRNEELKKRGIHCATSQDKMERQKARQQRNKTKLK